MANVYPVGQERIGEGLDLENPGAGVIRVVALKDAAWVFDKADLTLADVLVNGGSTLTKSGAAAVDLDNTAAMVVTDTQDTTGGADYVGTKTTFLAVATEAQWRAVIVYDEGGGTDATRIPIAGYTAAFTPNGSDVELHWDGVDGVGSYLESRNV